MCVHVLLSCGWEFEPRSSCLPSKFSNPRSHLSFINFYCFGLCSFVYQSLCGYVHMNAYVCEGQRHLFEPPAAGITSTCIISIFCRNRKRSLGHLSPRSLDFVVEMNSWCLCFLGLVLTWRGNYSILENQGLWLSFLLRMKESLKWSACQSGKTWL